MTVRPIDTSQLGPITCLPDAADELAKALDRYSILMGTDTTTPAERCKASGEVADAFLHEGNRESYQQWHAIHTIQCLDDGPMVIG